jgi:hypothetical protein
VFVREEASRHYPWNRLVERRRTLAWVTDVPGFGLVTLPAKEKRRRAVAPPEPVSAEGHAIVGNGMRIEAHAEGLTFRGPGDVRIDDWITLEAEGERGDLYTRSAIPGTRWRARLILLEGHGEGPPVRNSRATGGSPLASAARCAQRNAAPRRGGAPDIQTVIQLDAGAPFVRLRVTGQCRDSTFDSHWGTNGARVTSSAGRRRLRTNQS